MKDELLDEELRKVRRRIDFATLVSMVSSDATAEKKLRLLAEQQESLEAELRFIEKLRSTHV